MEEEEEPIEEFEESLLYSTLHELRWKLVAQMQKLQTVFRTWDDDNNGTVSRKEFRQGVALLGVDAGELAGTSAHLAEVWEREGADVEDAVYTAPDTWAALAALHERLLRRATVVDAPTEALTRAVAVARAHEVQRRLD